MPTATQSSSYDDIRKILIATDYSKQSELALSAAIDDAYQHAGFLHVVHVADPTLVDASEDGGMSAALAELQQFVAPKLFTHAELRDLSDPVRAICHVRTGNAGYEIAQLASDLQADVVYVSTHGRTGLRRVLLGSVAEVVIRRAPCPVIVMRPNENKVDGWAKPEDTNEVVIEPPCPSCLAMRRETRGATLWCAEHQPTLGRRHVHHHVPRTGQQRINPPLVFPEDVPR